MIEQLVGRLTVHGHQPWSEIKKMTIGEMVWLDKTICAEVRRFNGGEDR